MKNNVSVVSCVEIKLVRLNKLEHNDVNALLLRVINYVKFSYSNILIQDQ